MDVRIGNEEVPLAPTSGTRAWWLRCAFLRRMRKEESFFFLTVCSSVGASKLLVELAYWCLPRSACLALCVPVGVVVQGGDITPTA